MEKNQIIQQMKNETLNRIRAIYNPNKKHVYDEFCGESYSEQRESMVRYLIENLEKNLKSITDEYRQKISYFSGVLTKEQAIQAMRSGLLVTHDYFTDNEFIGMKGEYIIDENNYQLDWDDFWRYRKDEVWDNGWWLYSPKTPKKQS